MSSIKINKDRLLKKLRNGGDPSRKSLDPKFDKIAKKYEQKGWDSLTNEEQNYYRNLYDTYTKSENTLPLFTVLSAKKGSTGYNTLKALEDIKKDESLPVIQAWDQAGSPQINVEEYDMFNPHRAHTNNKDEMTIGKNVHGKAKYKDFLAELAHFYEKEQTGLTSFDHALKRTKEFIKLGDKKRYETPGTVEHNTHSVIEPRLDKAIRDKQQETEDLFWETNGKPFKTIDHLNKIKASEPFKIDLGENSNKKNGGSIGDPPTDKPIDWQSMIQQARQETIDYLQSPEWAEKSGGYDPTQLIQDVENANVIYDPAKYIQKGKGNQVIRDNGSVTMQLDLEKAIRAGQDPMDVIRHEFGHIGYPNFGKVNPTLEKQRREMLTRQKGYQNLTQEYSPDDPLYNASQYFNTPLSDNGVPSLKNINEGLVTGDTTSTQYKNVNDKSADNIRQMLMSSRYKNKGKNINSNLNANRPVAPHEIRQMIIERRANPENKRLEQFYSPEDIEYLMNTVASNNNQTNIPMAKKGGYLKDKNTYVTKDGKKTKRGLWANVYLKKKREGKLQDGGLVVDPFLEKGGEIGGFLQNIAPVVSMIPGAQPVGAGLGVLGNLMAKTDMPEQAGNMLQQYKLGGQFKQYNAPSHADGGQVIDMNGNPNAVAPAAEIEKNENSYRGYVYSDHLKDGDKTFAEKAKKINSMTNRDSDIDKKSKILQLARLRAKNDLARMQEQSVAPELVADMNVMKLGGYNTGPMAPEDPLLDYNLVMPSSITPYSDEVNPLDLQIYTNAKPMDMLPTKLDQYNTSPITGAGNRSYDRGLRKARPMVIGDDIVDEKDLQINQTDPLAVEPRGLSNMNKLAAGLKGAALVGSAVDALRKPEQEKLQLPDYSRGDQYIQDMSMDFAPQLAEINRGATKAVQSVSDQVGGIGQRSSRVASILARAGQNAAQTQLAQQQANNQLKASMAQRADRQSEITAQERIRQQDMQSRNEANARLAGRKFMQDLSKVGTTINQLEYAKEQMANMNEMQRKNTMFGLAMLAMKNPNFKPSDAFRKYIETGEGDYNKVLSEIISFE